MKITSTQNNVLITNALVALEKGLSSEGGLYIPLEFPHFELRELIEGNYADIQKRLLKVFFDELNPKEIDLMVDLELKKFSHQKTTPLIKAGRPFILELFHGPSAAFKDIALQLLPHLIQSKDKIHILTATSGDTGSAALEGFKHHPNYTLHVFYPKQGISEIQRKQMTCVNASNVYVYGIDGNFDDAQKAIKAIFNSELAQQFHLSSANSINIGRLIPQIAYYIYAYAQLYQSKTICLNDELVFSIPTGNFGNILAAYYAKKLGLPIKKLICASNTNDVLVQFIQTGIYDIRRDFHITSSPSMDILVSSNLERLLYDLAKQDSNQVKEWMHDLKENGYYQITSSQLKELQSLLSGHAVSEDQVLKTIESTYSNTKVLIDPHTAVAMDAANSHLKQNPEDIVIVAATASPYKFPKTVLEALKQSIPSSDFEAIQQLEMLTQTQAPPFLKDLENKEELHTTVLQRQDIHSQVKEDLLKCGK